MTKTHQLVFRAILIIIISHFSILSIGQTNDTISLDNNKHLLSHSLKNTNDTIKVKLIQDIDRYNTPDNSKNMPWIIAFIIGFITVGVNIYLGKRQRELSSNLLTQQLEFNEKSINLQYKNNLASKNRQDWINDLRNTISEFLSKGVAFKLSKSPEEQTSMLEKILFLKVKTELFLNEEEIEQVELKRIINIFTNSLSKDNDEYLEIQKEVVSKANHLFRIHWEKIKKIKDED